MTLAHRIILHPDGTHEPIPGDEPVTYEDAADLIGATMLDMVELGDGRIMLVDESGHPKGLPHNPAATRLYWSTCRPGATGTVVGPVVLLLVRDFDVS